MMGREERTRHAAGVQEEFSTSAARAHARKCVPMWQAYNRRRWEFEREFLEVDVRAPFVCECTSDECVEAVELTILEFEAAHMSSAWTAVIPGHTVAGDGSRVLTKHPHFWVVELYPVFDRNRV